MTNQEELLLSLAEEQSVAIRQFRCSKCLCQNSYLDGGDRATQIMQEGSRLSHRPYCRNRGCYCHTKLGAPTKIKTRVVDFGDVPF